MEQSNNQINQSLQENTFSREDESKLNEAKVNESLRLSPLKVLVEDQNLSLTDTFVSNDVVQRLFSQISLDQQVKYNKMKEIFSNMFEHLKGFMDIVDN